MVEDKPLKDAVLKIPEAVTLLEKLTSKVEKFFNPTKEKFAEIKVGEKTYKYSGEEFKTGVDIFDGESPLADGDYQTDTHQFTVKGGKVIDYKEKAAAPANDFEVQLRKQRDAFDTELTKYKTDINNKIAALTETVNAQSDILKDTHQLLKQILEAPVVPSSFKKKDGEPAHQNSKGDVFEQAKELSKKVFQN